MNEIVKIESKIYTIRGLQVMLDRDFSQRVQSTRAELYQVETKRINEAVKRNPEKFPDDLMFELSDMEFENLRSQNATSNFTKVRTNPKVWR